MRHRKKYLAAFLVLVAAYATVCFWPHSNPEAVRALAAMRGMIAIGEGGEPPQIANAKLRDDVQIELCVMIATINMTDATTGFFVEPGRMRDKPVVGRLRSDLEFLEAVVSTGASDVAAMPVLTTASGKRTGASVVDVGSGKEYEVAPAPPGGAPASVTVTHRYRAIYYSILAQVAAGDVIFLEVDCEHTPAGRTKTITTAQGSKQIDDAPAISAKASAQLKPGETLVIGGLSHKRPERTLVKLPGVSDLPGVGSWFTFTRQREIEEELVILVTPRIVTAVASR